MPYPGMFRVHNTNVYPERADRAYLGYLDAGAIILDISDMARPELLARWDNSPPSPGFTHTVLPLLDRDLLVVTEESIVPDAGDWPKLTWVLDAGVEANLVSISTLPLPPVAEFARRGGRFGSHNIHENPPKAGAWRSEQIVVGAFFNAGIRVFDLGDPYRPREVAHFVPEPPPGAPTGAIQMNDVFVDERGLVYGVDREGGGLYILELDL